MALLLRSVGRTEIARSLYRDITNENDFFYFFVGRTTEWDDEESPELPVDSPRYANTSSRNMLFVKRIEKSDTVLMIPRINWASGTVYDQYDDKYGELDANGDVYAANSGALSLKDSQFYVLTDDDHVYKCIFNNDNVDSTIKPTGTSISAIETADGYIWKFMFKVEASDKIKFLTPEYIPVRKIAGSGDPEFDVNGEIDAITITNAGSSYETAPIVTINGDGVGANATASVAGGEVTNISLTESGSGYSFAYITFSGGGGSGAAASVLLTATESGTVQEDVENAAIPGTIDRLEIISGGIDYVDGDAAVAIVGDGSGAEAILDIDGEDGSILSVTITNRGSGYTFADVTIAGTEGVGAELIAVISPRAGHGSNPQKELFATNVGFSVNLTNDSADLFLNNDFRQIGVVKNPLIFDSNNNFQSSTGNCCYVIAINNPEDVDYDDIIESDDGGRFIVVQKTAAGALPEDTSDSGVVNRIHLLPIIPQISGNSILTNLNQQLSLGSPIPDSFNIGTVLNPILVDVLEPEVDNKTGEIIYLDNREFIVRQQDQVEKIRAILKF
jgi:hypothetical protein